MKETTVRLLLIAGVIFVITKQWLIAALLGAGALCCAAAAFNFRNRKDEK